MQISEEKLISMHLNVLRQDFQVAFYYKNLSSPIKINQQALGIRDWKQTSTFPGITTLNGQNDQSDGYLLKRKSFF